MTSRTGSLSDEAILAHCQRYRPIPLGAAQHILMKDLKPQHEHAFGSKPLKYHTIMTRPKDFDTLAKAITKMSGNPMVREELIAAYAKDLQISSHTAAPGMTSDEENVPNTPDSVGVHPRGSGYRTPPTNVPDTLHLEADSLIKDIDSRDFSARRASLIAQEREIESLIHRMSPREPQLQPGSDPFTPMRNPNRLRLPNLPHGFTRERLILEEQGYSIDSDFPSYSVKEPSD